jgi:flagellar basal-body rod modification protein FlgD
VEIVDSSGQRVRTLHLGTQSAGLQHFHWDGLDDAGAAQPPGRYLIRGSINNEAAPTLAVGRVNSVSINGNSVELNLQGMNTAPFGSVRQIF